MGLWRVWGWSFGLYGLTHAWVYVNAGAGLPWFMFYAGLLPWSTKVYGAAAGLYGFMVYHVVLLWFMMQVKVCGLWFTMLFKGLCVNVGFMVYDAS